MSTVLAPGDLAITKVQTDDPDSFNFILLTDIESGTEIFFTDNGVYQDGSFRGGEGIVKYTAPSNVLAGSVIEFAEISGDFSVEDLGFALATLGDQVIAYQGTVADPNFIYAVQTNSTQFQTDSTSSNNSALPLGLEVGISAVAVGKGAGDEDEFDNSSYNNIITSGTKAELLAAISNAANWNGSDDVISSTTVPFIFNNDSATGSSSPDTIFAGSDNDVLSGLGGQDRLHGEAGSDRIDGGADDDFISGGVDNDDISGGDGADFLLGDAGADLISGGDGDDVLMGGEDNDTLNGGAGVDRLSGFGGSDVFVLTPKDTNNIIYDYTDGLDMFGLELDRFAENTVADVYDALSINQSGSAIAVSYGSELLATVYNVDLGMTDLTVEDFTEF